MDPRAIWQAHQSDDIGGWEGEVCFYLSAALGRRGLRHKLRHVAMLAYEKRHNSVTGCPGCQGPCALLSVGGEAVPVDAFWDILFES